MNERMLGSQTVSEAKPVRQADTFLENEHDQRGRFAHLMGRVEDLADRIAGGVPMGEVGKDGPTPPSSGFIGTLFDIQRDREDIGSRLSAALDRIERVL